jgi:hypothetical protein
VVEQDGGKTKIGTDDAGSCWKQALEGWCGGVELMRGLLLQVTVRHARWRKERGSSSGSTKNPAIRLDWREVLQRRAQASSARCRWVDTRMENEGRKRKRKRREGRGGRE